MSPHYCISKPQQCSEAGRNKKRESDPYHCKNTCSFQRVIDETLVGFAD